MATSERNLLLPNGGGNQRISTMESGLPASDYALAGMQPLGSKDGRHYEVTARDLLQAAGTQWIHTMVDGDGDAAQVIAIQDPTATLGSFLKIQTNDKQHDNNQIQYGVAKTLGSTTVTAYAPFVAKAGYNIHFECRFRIHTGLGSGTVALTSLLMGLSVVDTTLLASSAIGTTDFIGFYKAASATMGGVVRTSSTSTTTALTAAGVSGFTPTISTWYTVGFKLNGRTSITYYVDFGNGNSVSSTTMTNLPANTVVLTPSIAVGNSSTVACELDIAGFYCGQEAW